jgi:hypothetical protein
MARIVLTAPSLDRTSDSLTQRLRVDADFDTRWAAWQSRGRSRERAFHRRLLMWSPAAALAAAIVFWFLIR